MRYRAVDMFSVVVFAWALFVLLLNFAVPTKWYFEYEYLTVPNIICSGEKYQVAGGYWSKIDTPASGVDHVVDMSNGVRKDRYPWDNGKYKAGHSVGGWKLSADLVPGTYRIESTELRLNFLRIFPIYLNNDERPVSNTFEVINCT